MLGEMSTETMSIIAPGTAMVGRGKEPAPVMAQCQRRKILPLVTPMGARS